VSRRVHRSALVAAPAALMFDLIDRVENYPSFLPWCVATRLIERSDELVSATVTVGWKQLRIEVTTRNPKRVPERMEIHLEGGTFRHFMGLWELRPLGERGCRVDFTLDYELALPGADRVAGNLIDHAADRMVDAFVIRAENLFGAASDTWPQATPQAAAAPVKPPATLGSATP
jgi:ribosome-associated toxin RatA of RatAB toxin-antitoxin module